MKKIFSKNVIIALTVLMSIALLFWGIEFLKGVNLFKPANFYYVTFNEVNGLVDAAPVKVNGFQVGQVREINFDYNTDKISVMMSLNPGLKIPQGSTVSIESSLTGTASLAINLNKGNDSYVEVGGTIAGVEADGLMSKVNNDIMPSIVAILPKIDSIMTNINTLTSNPALYSAVGRLDAITADLARSSAQLNQLMAQLNRSVPGVMNNVSSITTNLTGTTENFSTFSSTLNQLPIDSTVASLNATVANLQQISEKLNDKNSTLGLLLNDRSLYESANRSVASLDSLLTDVKKNPKRYVTIKVF